MEEESDGGKTGKKVLNRYLIVKKTGKSDGKVYVFLDDKEIKNKSEYVTPPVRCSDIGSKVLTFN